LLRKPLLGCQCPDAIPNVTKVMIHYNLLLARKKMESPADRKASNGASSKRAAFSGKRDSNHPAQPTFTYANSRVTLGGTYAPLILTRGVSRLR